MMSNNLTRVTKFFQMLFSSCCLPTYERDIGKQFKNKPNCCIKCGGILFAIMKSNFRKSYLTIYKLTGEKS